MAGLYELSNNLQSKVNLDETVARCRETSIDPLILDGISSIGLGSDLALEAELDENGELKLYHFMQYIYIQ